MNDKPQTEDAKAFDPAAHGWEPIVNHTAFGDLVGPIWRSEQNGQPRFGFKVESKHLNRAGNLHGGMLMTLADQAMAMAGRKVNGARRQATMELNIQFVGPAHLGEFVEAHPEVVRMTRSVIFLAVKMYVGSRIVAAATGIWKILDEA